MLLCLPCPGLFKDFLRGFEYFPQKLSFQSSNKFSQNLMLSSYQCFSKYLEKQNGLVLKAITGFRTKLLGNVPCAAAMLDIENAAGLGWVTETAP